MQNYLSKIIYKFEKLVREQPKDLILLSIEFFPLFGIIFLSWDIVITVVFYWFEILIMFFFFLLNILMSKDVDPETKQQYLLTEKLHNLASSIIIFAIFWLACSYFFSLFIYLYEILHSGEKFEPTTLGNIEILLNNLFSNLPLSGIIYAVLCYLIAFIIYYIEDPRLVSSLANRSREINFRLGSLIFAISIGVLFIAWKGGAIVFLFVMIISQILLELYFRRKNLDCNWLRVTFDSIDNR